MKGSTLDLEDFDFAESAVRGSNTARKKPSRCILNDIDYSESIGSNIMNTCKKRFEWYRYISTCSNFW